MYLQGEYRCSYNASTLSAVAWWLMSETLRWGVQRVWRVDLRETCRATGRLR